MEVIYAPILLAKNRNHIAVNLIMRTDFPIRFTMTAPNIGFIVPTAMIAEVFLLEDQPVIIGRHQNKTIRILPKEYFKVNFLRFFSPFVQERT